MSPQHVHEIGSFTRRLQQIMDETLGMVHGTESIKAEAALRRCVLFLVDEVALQSGMSSYGVLAFVHTVTYPGYRTDPRSGAEEIQRQQTVTPNDVPSHYWAIAEEVFTECAEAMEDAAKQADGRCREAGRRLQ